MRDGESGPVVCERAVALVCNGKQELQLGKELLLRDSQSKTTNLFPKHEADFPLEEHGEIAGIYGAKRLKLTCSNPLCQQLGLCSCSKGNLGSEIDGKLRRESFDLNADWSEAVESATVTKEENTGHQFNHPQGTVISSRSRVVSTPPAFFQSCSSQKPSLFHTPAKLNHDAALSKPGIALPSPSAIDSQGTCIHHWKERFVRLQLFLKQCDEANCDEHVKMLRSLTAAGRSRHALELERRAIHLLLEEEIEKENVQLDWWGHKHGFVWGGFLGTRRAVKRRPDSGRPNNSSAECVPIHSAAFREQDQENLYKLVQDKATSGKQGLGIKDRPKKICGSYWKAKKTSFGDSDDEYSSHSDGSLKHKDVMIETEQLPKPKLKKLCKALLSQATGKSMKIKDLKVLTETHSVSLFSQFSSERDAVLHLKRRVIQSAHIVKQ